MPGHDAELITLDDRGQDERCLGQREHVADALARAASEGQVGEAFLALDPFGRETLRFKGVGPLLIDTLTREIAQAAPWARVVRPAFEPVVGSLLLAYDAAGIDITETILAKVAATLPGESFFDTQDGRGYRAMGRT